MPAFVNFIKWWQISVYECRKASFALAKGFLLASFGLAFWHFCHEHHRPQPKRFLATRSVCPRRLWDFYPSNFIDPDSTQSVEDNFRVRLNTLWNDIEGFGTRWTAFGYATYQVKVFVPANRPELGLKIPDMYTAYRLYANGELVSQNGVPGKKKSSAIPKWIPKIVPVKAPGDSLTLTLHVSNF